MFTIVALIFQKALVCTVGGIRIGIFDVTSILLILRYLYTVKFKFLIDKIGKMAFTVWGAFFLISLLSGIFLNGYEIKIYGEYYGIFQIDSYYVKIDTSLLIVLGRLLLYIFVFVIIYNWFKDKESNDIEYFVVKTINISLIIITVVGVMQLANYYGLIDFSFVLEIVHDINSGGSAYYENYDRLYSCFAEPSYCAPWLNAVFWFLVCFKSRVNNKLRYLIMLIVFIEYLLCRSFTGYIAFVLMSLYWGYTNKGKKIFYLYLLVILFGIVVFIYSPLGSQIGKLVIEKSESTSGLARVAFIQDCYRVFFDTNFWGVGYMQIKSMTLISGLLAQVGIIGTMTFIIFIYNLLKIKTQSNIEKAVKIFFLATIVGGEVSCSGLHWLVEFWFGLYLYAMTSGYINHKIKRLKIREV